VLTPDATAPNALIYPANVGAALPVAALLTLGVDLVRRRPEDTRAPAGAAGMSAAALPGGRRPGGAAGADSR
jgi:hypothetical protein